MVGGSTYISTYIKNFDYVNKPSVLDAAFDLDLPLFEGVLEEEAKASSSVVQIVPARKSHL